MQETTSQMPAVTRDTLKELLVCCSGCGRSRSEVVIFADITAAMWSKVTPIAICHDCMDLLLKHLVAVIHKERGHRDSLEQSV